jgi:hypothetical protein
MIREQALYLEIHRNPDFHITPEIKEKLLKISPAQIDRSLKADRRHCGIHRSHFYRWKTRYDR